MAHRPASRRTTRQEGAALVMVLLLTTAALSLGMGVVTLGSTETAIAGHHRAATATFYAADAAVEYAAQTLTAIVDWDRVLDGRMQSPFLEAPLPGTVAVDLTAAERDLQARAAASAGAGQDTPRWKLFAHGPVSRLLGVGSIDSRAYVAVWVADDRFDGDGNPLADANGVVMLTAGAFGDHRTRRMIEAGVIRSSMPTTGSPDEEASPMITRFQFWREVR
jgi:hypothetical protein